MIFVSRVHEGYIYPLRHIPNFHLGTEVFSECNTKKVFCTSKKIRHSSGIRNVEAGVPSGSIRTR